MEWMNQASRPAQPANQTTNPNAGSDRLPRSDEGNKKRRRGKSFSLAHIPFAVLLFSITVVIVAVVSLLMLVKNNSEARYVDSSKMQAVFLNGGQVYFGRISTLNDDYIRMREIYYLRVNQQVQPGNSNANSQQDISLVKLGCELHGPDDQMLINRDQVVFWENLKSDGQVAKAVEEYRKANPGTTQKCETGQQGTPTNQNTTTNSNTQQNTPNNSNTQQNDNDNSRVQNP